MTILLGQPGFSNVKASYCHTVVFTRQDHGLSSILMDYWKCPVPTHIEERVDAPGTVSDNEERVAGHLITGVLSWLVELARVRDQDP